MSGKIALPNRHATLRVMPMPRDTNAAGDIFGGWIMSHVDMAAAIEAGRRAGGRVVTVAVNAFSFKQPVSVRDVVSFYAEVVKVGTTSLVIEVAVYAERGFLSAEAGSIVKVTEATLTFVAVYERGRKRPVPPA